MLSRIIATLCVSLPLLLTAQTTAPATAPPSPVMQGRHVEANTGFADGSLGIHVMPIRALWENPRLGAGFHFRTGRFLLGLDFAYANQAIFDALKTDPDVSNYSYINFQPELKYIIAAEEKGLLYTSLAVDIRHYGKNIRNGSFFDHPNQEHVAYTEARMDYSRIGVTPKLGLIRNYGKHLYLDFSFGFSFYGHRNTDYEDLEGLRIIVDAEEREAAESAPSLRECYAPRPLAVIRAGFRL